MLTEKSSPEEFFQRLVEVFPAATREQWRAAAEQLLKGKPPDEVLRTPTPEGITLEPMYWADDLQGLSHVESFPGSVPFVRGGHAAGRVISAWWVAQQIPESLPEQWNTALQGALDGGQTAVWLRLDEPARSLVDADAAASGTVGRGGVSISALADLSAALHGVDRARIPLLISCGASALFLGGMLAAWGKNRDVALAGLPGCLGADPLGELARTGQLPVPLSQLYDEMAMLTEWTSREAPQLQTVMIQTDLYHNAGANAVQELAFMLATGAEYMRAMRTRGLSPETAGGTLAATLAVGSNFFGEIAKLRAARMLWQQMITAFGAEPAASRLFIHATTSGWNKTRYDAHVNLLRTTVEAFAAVLGGCDSLQVGPFDEASGQPGEFSQRLARNIQLILREECHAHRVIDPLGGSWYGEKLTAQLAESAWAMFQEIERRGGMAEALELGIPQQMIAETAQRRMERLAFCTDVLVGINQYANPQEDPEAPPPPDWEGIWRQRREELENQRRQRDGHACQNALSALRSPENRAKIVELLAEAAACGATLGEMRAAIRGEGAEITRAMPLKLHRGAEPYEKLRDAVRDYRKAHGHLPQVFLAGLGQGAQLRARVEFVRGFFEIVGLPVIVAAAADDIETAAAAVQKAAPAVVVVCGKDEDDPRWVPPFVRQIKAGKSALQVLLAGHPGGHEKALRAAGVDAFIYRNCNALETLQRVLGKCGIHPGGTGPPSTG